jgi:membrane protease YdiL (CAAX protease family)
VGLFAVLPLWLCYEALRLSLTPNERNGAEVLMAEGLRLLGPTAFLWLRIVFAATVLAAAAVLLRRHIPWLRVSLVNALEGTVYALILGPLSAALAASSSRLLQAASGGESELVRNLVGSLGAGIFEELVFRLLLMSVLALAFTRAAVSFGLPRVLGVILALVLSSVIFSLFHHLGPGAPAFSQRQFVFRAFAGMVLGVLFVLRGFGVCVYTHAMYDVHYYLTAGAGG